MKDYHKILDLAPNASEEEIRPDQVALTTRTPLAALLPMVHRESLLL